MRGGIRRFESDNHRFAYVLPSMPRLSSTSGPDGFSHHPGFLMRACKRAGKGALRCLVYALSDLVSLGGANGTVCCVSFGADALGNKRSCGSL